MSRWWTRSEQRKYREDRRKQAALVADRLLGKQTIDPDVEAWAWPNAGSQFISPYLYKHIYNMQVLNPRGNIVITGLSI